MASSSSSSAAAVIDHTGDYGMAYPGTANSTNPSEVNILFEHDFARKPEANESFLDVGSTRMLGATSRSNYRRLNPVPASTGAAEERKLVDQIHHYMHTGDMDKLSSLSPDRHQFISLVLRPASPIQFRFSAEPWKPFAAIFNAGLCDPYFYPWTNKLLASFAERFFEVMKYASTIASDYRRPNPSLTFVNALGNSRVPLALRNARTAVRTFSADKSMGKEDVTEAEERLRIYTMMHALDYMWTNGLRGFSLDMRQTLIGLPPLERRPYPPTIDRKAIAPQWGCAFSVVNTFSPKYYRWALPLIFAIAGYKNRIKVLILDPFIKEATTDINSAFYSGDSEEDKKNDDALTADITTATNDLWDQLIASAIEGRLADFKVLINDKKNINLLRIIFEHRNDTYNSYLVRTVLKTMPSTAHIYEDDDEDDEMRAIRFDITTNLF